jgi:hypothetical protein
MFEEGGRGGERQREGKGVLLLLARREGKFLSKQ